ncbi:MAG: S8 family serine peptidase [Bacteroidota bacterium]
MNTQKSSPKWVTLLIVGLIFFSPALLQGCDSFGVHDAPPESAIDTKPAPDLSATTKFRHVELLDAARSEFTAAASASKNNKNKNKDVDEDSNETGTSSSAVHLVVGLSPYAGADVTRRVISKYDVTRRVISKYGDDINVKAELEEAIDAVTLEVNGDILNDLLADLEADQDVAWVEPDIIIPDINSGSKKTSNSSQMLPWGVAQVGGSLDSWENSNVQVFVLDSGVSESSEINLVSSVDFVGFYDSRSGTYQSYEKLPDNKKIKDKIGHGSPIAGTIGARNNDEGIRGVAPGIGINSVKVLGKDGGTDVTTLLLAIDYIMYQQSLNPKFRYVVNMSLGGDIGTTAYNAVDEAVANAIEAGIVFVVAAGNEGMDAATISPAHVDGAITVGAYGRDGEFSEFSNYGPAIDLLAPGEDIASLSGKYEQQGSLIIASGTSHATPHVAGAAALYLAAHPNATPDEVERALVLNAQSIIQDTPASTTNKSVFVTP